MNMNRNVIRHGEMDETEGRRMAMTTTFFKVLVVGWDLLLHAWDQRDLH